MLVRKARHGGLHAAGRQARTVAEEKTTPQPPSRDIAED